MEKCYYLFMSTIHVAPSLLAANFSDMKSAVELIDRSGGDFVHLDVMDGHFVPVLTFGSKFVSDIRPLTNLPLDVHLMVREPEKFVDAFIEAGSDIITFHFEATIHIHRLLEYIRSRNVKAGISVVPTTPVEHLQEVLPFVDNILVMGVNPGFGGQIMIDGTVKRINKLSGMRSEMNYGFRISVDGGVNRNNVAGLIKAGADVLVTGSGFFESEDPAGEIAFIKEESRRQV